jgi:hypothetical protein
LIPPTVSQPSRRCTPHEDCSNNREAVRSSVLNQGTRWYSGEAARHLHVMRGAQPSSVNIVLCGRAWTSSLSRDSKCGRGRSCGAATARRRRDGQRRLFADGVSRGRCPDVSALIDMADRTVAHDRGRCLRRGGTLLPRMGRWHGHAGGVGRCGHWPFLARDASPVPPAQLEGRAAEVFCAHGRRATRHCGGCDPAAQLRL